MFKDNKLIPEATACKLVGLKRSTVQRFSSRNGSTYTKKILNPIEKKKDNCSYFYYNDDEMEKLWLIKLLKSIGKSNSDIVKIMANSKFNIKIELSKAIEELERLINVTKVYIGYGIGYKFINDLSEEKLDISEINNKLFALSDVVLKNSDFTILSTLKSEQIDMSDLTKGIKNLYDLACRKEEDNKEFNKILDILFENYQLMSYEDNRIQNIINDMRKDLFGDEYYSPLIMQFILLTLEIMIKEEDNNTSEETMEFNKFLNYLTQAIGYYIDNPVGLDDIKYIDLEGTLNEIEKFAYNGYSTSSKEIQNLIQNLYCTMRLLYKDNTLAILDIFGKSFSTEEMINKYDNGNKKGILWFVNRSIEIFIQNNSGSKDE